MNQLGSTRGCHKTNHLLQTPDTFVRAPLPGMKNATAIVHAAPMMGARFTEYTAELEAGGYHESNDYQRFIYVLSGRVNTGEDLREGGYHYFPAGKQHRIEATEPSRVLIIEKPYQELRGADAPEPYSNNSSSVEPASVLGDPDVRVQMLLPEKPSFDFAVNLMTFDPGASLPLTEIHFMEHGLLQLSGGGIYRLGDCWHPISAGDFIWMAPYCPQWFGALGKQPAKYILYKDWNRNPEVR